MAHILLTTAFRPGDLDPAHESYPRVGLKYPFAHFDDKIQIKLCYQDAEGNDIHAVHIPDVWVRNHPRADPPDTDLDTIHLEMPNAALPTFINVQKHLLDYVAANVPGMAGAVVVP